MRLNILKYCNRSWVQCPPWRDIAGIFSCFVKITIYINIDPTFKNQVWARGSEFKVIIMKKVFESVSNKEFIRFFGYVMRACT